MIKAIETVYKGYRFRSRLEARWAVFFDALGLVWDYEVEGYELGQGLRYLPDFLLPKLDTIFEVKYNYYQIEKQEKKKVAAMSRERVVLFSIPSVAISEKNIALAVLNGKVWHYAFGVCCKCSDAGILIMGPMGASQTLFVMDCQTCQFRQVTNLVDMNTLHGRVQDAYVAARSARFEHGEQPHF